MASKPVAARIKTLWSEVANAAHADPTPDTIARRNAVETLVRQHRLLTDREIVAQFREVRDRVFSAGELRRMGLGEEAAGGE